ncbi:hypothetical protein BCF74_10121 [Knoellia remsis]|uniref:Excreted virulence factor EspC (Type VII ESX diderm) n=1 Tax=Knoellia remsis TaxID=407159 RepID=A0A2T0V0A9_9MICO|nr:hypothetical protein [Knoellia remsis]PRY63623.1 hypothetical protein BCF74_10121 [Knoellia remsis]
MSYEAERQALLDAAETWADAENDMTKAKNNAVSIDVTTTDSSVVADLAGFNSTYSDIRTRVADLLGEAASSMKLIDDTLKGIEEQYRRDDEDALARIGGQWSPTNP